MKIKVQDSKHVLIFCFHFFLEVANLHGYHTKTTKSSVLIFAMIMEAVFFDSCAFENYVNSFVLRIFPNVWHKIKTKT